VAEIIGSAVPVLLEDDDLAALADALQRLIRAMNVALRERKRELVDDA
jgi:hypothetical protein